jgi:hypothetical protein
MIIEVTNSNPKPKSISGCGKITQSAMLALKILKEFYFQNYVK